MPSLRHGACVQPIVASRKRSGWVRLDPPRAMRTLYEFHRNVLLGSVGSNLVGIAGALLLTSAVTGFLVAMPRRRSGWRRVIGGRPVASE